ncbi:MAG: hypothetical protein ACTSRG_17080 [Candidatus Helarchaeota archaeon]
MPKKHNTNPNIATYHVYLFSKIKKSAQRHYKVIKIILSSRWLFKLPWRDGTKLKIEFDGDKMVLKPIPEPQTKQ